MGHQKYNILYLDDEQSNLRIFKTVYRHYYNIYSAISADEAYAILEKNPIHLIISDQRMPEMTGVEFLKEVKKKWPEPKCILLTAYSDHEVLKEAINVVGIWRYINKPYNHDDLRLVMDNALEAYQLKIDRDILNDELEFRREKLEKMMDTTLYAIITIDDSENIVMANRAAGKLFGYKIDELTGKPLNILIPEEKRKVHSKHIKSFEKDKKTSMLMRPGSLLFGLTSGGEKIPIETSLSKLKVKGGHYYNAFIRDISDRLRAEREIKESEEKFRTFTESARVAIFVLKDRKVWYVNKECEELLEYTRKELQQMEFTDIIHPDSLQLVTENYQKRIDGKYVDPRYEIKIITKSGKTKDVDNNEARIELNGEPAILVSFLDITDKKKARQELLESELQKRLIFETALDGIITINQKGEIIDWNTQAEVIFGWKRDEVMGKKLSQVVIPEDFRAKHEEGLKNYLKTGKGKVLGTRIEIEGIRKNGELFPAELSINPMKIGDQTHFSGFVRDISERKQAAQDLTESEERFRLAMKGANDGLWDWDIITNEVYYSPRWKSMLGYKENEISDEFETWEKLIHPDDLKNAHLVFETYLSRKQGNYEVEFRMQHKNGEYKSILSRGFGIKNKAGDIIRIVGTHVDITARKEADERVRKLNEELEERVKIRTAQLEKANQEIKEADKELRIAFEKEKSLGELKSRFVSTASHQFRTPLTVIRSNVELLQMQADLMDDKLKPKFEKASGRINHEVKRMTDLMNDVLILGKINAGRVPFEPKPTDVVSVCRELVNKYNGIQSDGREVNFKIEGNQVKFIMDEKLFGHAISNLLSNALKYSEGRGNPELALLFNKNLLKISVADKGIGIPENEIGNLFQPFFRAVNASETPGTGLGLAISKEYIELNGGTIEVKSKQNKGTTFNLEFQAKK